MKDDSSNFARLVRDLLPPDMQPASNVMALGYLLREWLANAVVDGGTSVDTGIGAGSFDLWATVEGREVFINVRDSNAQLAKDRGVVGGQEAA